MVLSAERAVLGRAGLEVGRLGVSASYGVPAAAVERAFERGCNYLYWGSIRRDAFAEALRNLRPRRDKVVLVMQSYSRAAFFMRWTLERGLRKIGYDFADVLLLGLWNKEIAPRILDAARELQARGLVRHLAVSSHERKSIPAYTASPDIGIVHFRYNAVHTGAERDIFPRLPAEGRAGTVSYTATSWGQLLKSKRIPVWERRPAAADAYRFVLARPEIDVCMTGPSNAEQMDEALRALDLPPMSADELTWIRRVGAEIYGQ